MAPMRLTLAQSTFSMNRPALQFLLFGLLQLPVILIGLPLVAIGLPFRRTVDGLVRLPKWLLPWDNIVDGLLGDKRGKYAASTAKWNPLFAMWWWAAVRNPANYFKRFILACDVSRCVITKLAGQDYVRDDFDSEGWQLLQAVRDDGRKYYHFYWVRRWRESDRALVIELGFKFRLGHVIESGIDRFKGFTFEVAPWKNIR